MNVITEPVIAETQSYSWIILNAVYNRLVATPFFEEFTCKRINRALPIEAGVQIPFLGVYLSDDTFIADGDLNAGDIRFVDTVVIGFQVIVKNNDSTAMLQTLDRATWLIQNRLLRDNTFTNRLIPNTPDSIPIDGVARGRVRERWGMTGARNETPVGERLLEMSFQFRTEWYPGPFPDLERVTVTTAFPPGDPIGQSRTQQVKTVYEFTPDSVPTPLPPDS